MGDETQSNAYSAAPSAAGYLYQARLALLLALTYVNRDSNIEVSIEALDDISFEREGSAFELLQSKHRMDHLASLTDTSPDIWKTLRIWAEAAASDPSLPGRVRFALITTGSAANGSIAAMLRPASSYELGQRRNPKAAAIRFAEIAQSSTNKDLKRSFEAFLALSQPMRASLLSAVEIVDRQPNLIEVENEIEEALRMLAPRGKAGQAREFLEGWWWPRVSKALMSTPPGSVSVSEIETKLDEIRELLKRESLSLDFEDAEPSDEEAAGYDAFRFIGQLRAIGLQGARLQWAKRDFYRAFSQRSKWTRDHAIYDGELAQFERLLVEEWEPRHATMCEKAAHHKQDDPELRTAGQDLFHWVETEARFPFRAIITRSLSVGSYHILADDARIGWHRDYRSMFAGDES